MILSALRWLGLYATLAILGGYGAATASADDSYYEKVLREKNIEPDAAGLSAYLKSLHPDEAQRRRAAQLIRDLGSSDSFAKREAAMSGLLVLPVLPTEALLSASKGSDPEVRWRAKQVLATGKVEADRTLYAAMRTIQDKKPAGLLDDVLRAIPLCDKAHLSYAARQALRAVARPDDAAALRRAIQEKNVELRVAAIAALGNALKKDSARELSALLDDDNDQVELAAARAMADFGERKCLPALVGLLSSQDGKVRVSAAVALRAVSGKSFGYASYDTPGKRKIAIDKWTAWAQGDGRTAKLRFPLKPFGIGVSYLNGNTLLAFGYRNRVVEYDPSEREVWSSSINGAWSAEKTADGNVLIASNNGNRVVLVNRDQKVIWEYSAQNPLNAKPLPGGNVLIAQFSGNAGAIEVTPGKKVVWQYKTSNMCSDVHRLENGNTLVAFYQLGVREVTPGGEVVWEFKTPSCYSCQPLPSGNVLITDIQGRVMEVSREKKVIWEHRANSPVDAFRLSSGNTLITESNRYIEVTPEGKVIWSKTGCSYGTARR